MESNSQELAELKKELELSQTQYNLARARGNVGEMMIEDSKMKEILARVNQIGFDYHAKMKGDRS